MSLRVTVVDEQTGDTETARVADGDFLLIVVRPCRVDGYQSYPAKGTVVATIKDHRPQPLPEPKEFTDDNAPPQGQSQPLDDDRHGPGSPGEQG